MCSSEMSLNFYQTTQYHIPYQQPNGLLFVDDLISYCDCKHNMIHSCILLC
ncbi:hypothetical protein B7P43_G05791 [Cryptotermes secundus]|uniref:Uncharacterized protein n=1 Tax=Cryptotermes secundus TaxID=105785 RepID=A0A2J7RHK5_9NEOP|nr:hypothetical protein B7P43_G05791 [Cryptotermes secundus]